MKKIPPLKRKRRSNVASKQTVKKCKVKIKKEQSASANYSNVNYEITSYQNNIEIENINSDSE